MKKVQKYIRLLTYDDACLIIDFINNFDGGNNYANITAGGVSMSLDELCLVAVQNQLNDMGVRYEINDEHPEATNAGIVNWLKQTGQIETQE